MDTTQIDSNVNAGPDTSLATSLGPGPSPGPVTGPGTVMPYAVTEPGTSTSADGSAGAGNPGPNVGTGAPARLYRSRTDSVLGGVCGGLAHYLGIDPVVVRLIFVVLVLAGFGTGLLIYLIMWLVVPLEGQGGSVPLEHTMRYGADEIAQRAHTFGNDLRQGTGGGRQVALLMGGVLLLLGLVFLAQNLFGGWLPWLGMGTLWPLILIVAGIALVVQRSRRA